MLTSGFGGLAGNRPGHPDLPVVKLKVISARRLRELLRYASGYMNIPNMRLNYAGSIRFARLACLTAESAAKFGYWAETLHVYQQERAA
jgi:hypothetical protein